MFNEYPYVNLQDVNLDWILKHIKDLEVNLQDFVKLNTIKYADPIIWNITKQYETNTVVIDGNTGTAYLSVQPVPAGVALTNTDYWTVIFTLNLTTSNQNITFRDDGTNVLATFASNTGDWILWNFYLYRVTQPISVNTAYVEGFNIERFSVELFIRDYINTLSGIIGDLDDLTTSDKTSIVEAINSLLTDINTTIGDLDDLTTSDKTSIVEAINSLLTDINTTIGDLDDLDTSDKTSIVNAINEIANRNLHLNPVDFGAVCDRNTDDSVAVQSMFDYALANNIAFATFDGIDEISFKNVEIKSDITIDFGTCKIYEVPYAEQRGYGLFYINSEINVVFYRGEFIGCNTSGAFNPTQMQCYSAIYADTCRSFKMIDAYIHDFNNRNDINASSTDPDDWTSVFINLYDTNYIYLDNCKFDKIYGEEANAAYPRIKDRKDCDFFMKSCSITNCTTSFFDVVGNNLELAYNIYNYNYPGSLVNMFGLNVNIHDELSLGTVNNVYDTCEQHYFQSDFVNIENVHIKNALIAIDVASRSTRIRNVKIDEFNTNDSENYLVRLNKGYGGNNFHHKDNGTAELESASIDIVDCDFSNLNGRFGFILHTDAFTSHNPNIRILRSVTNKNSDIAKNNLWFIANNCNLTISECLIYHSYNNISSAPMGFGIPSFAKPKTIIVANNQFVNLNANNSERMTNSITITQVPGVIVGNMAAASVADTISSETPTSVTVGVNHNYS